MSLTSKAIFDRIRKCKLYQSSVPREMYLFPWSMEGSAQGNEKKCRLLDEGLYRYKPTTHGEIMNLSPFSPNGIRVGLRRHNINPHLEYFEEYDSKKWILIFVIIILIFAFTKYV